MPAGTERHDNVCVGRARLLELESSVLGPGSERSVKLPAYCISSYLGAPIGYAVTNVMFQRNVLKHPQTNSLKFSLLINVN